MKMPRLPKFVVKILAWILSTNFWNEIIRMNFRLKGYPALSADNYFNMRDIIRSDPNALYMFVGADDANAALKIQKLVLKIRWAHSGFVELGEDGELWASHVRHSGYRYYNLSKYLKEVDHFALIKLKFSNSSNESIAKARYEKIKASTVIYSLNYEMQKRPQYKVDPLKWDKPFYLYCSEYQYIVCMDLVNDWNNGKSELTPDEIHDGGEVVFEG